MSAKSGGGVNKRAQEASPEIADVLSTSKPTAAQEMISSAAAAAAADLVVVAEAPIKSNSETTALGRQTLTASTSKMAGQIVTAESVSTLAAAIPVTTATATTGNATAVLLDKSDPQSIQLADKIDYLFQNAVANSAFNAVSAAAVKTLKSNFSILGAFKKTPASSTISSKSHSKIVLVDENDNNNDEEEPMLVGSGGGGGGAGGGSGAGGVGSVTPLMMIEINIGAGAEHAGLNSSAESAIASPSILVTPSASIAAHAMLPATTPRSIAATTTIASLQPITSQPTTASKQVPSNNIVRPPPLLTSTSASFFTQPQPQSDMVSTVSGSTSDAAFNQQWTKWKNPVPLTKETLAKHTAEQDELYSREIVKIRT
jgi:hypothetical protein